MKTKVSLNRMAVAVILATLMTGSAYAQNWTTLAHAGDSKEPPEEAGTSPLIILSEKVGDVGREAIGSGVPVMQGASMADFPGMKVLYADIDSINKDSYSVVVDSIRRALNQGTMVALETSDFNFEKLRNFVSLNFPAIDSAGIDDVAVLLRQDGGLIRAERIDPSELAMYAGVPFENTTAGEYSRLVIDEESSSRALPSGIKYTLEFAAKAYDSAPTHSAYSLKYNGTYVDVWRKMYYPTTDCIVAWRGTVITHLPDVYADLSSQASYSSVSITNQRGVTMKGGKGFVNRLHAYDDTVLGKLASEGCTRVTVTGHSLGGAVASIHALQLAHNTTWRSRLRDVVVYNSPNVVDDATRKTPATTLKSYASSVHVNCRYHDWLVNPLPTGLHRIGNADSSPVKGCTYVKTGTTWSPLPTTNHNLSLWEAEF